jgi:hypothetical protein
MQVARTQVARRVETQALRVLCQAKLAPARKHFQMHQTLQDLIARFISIQHVDSKANPFPSG